MRQSTGSWWKRKDGRDARPTLSGAANPACSGAHLSNIFSSRARPDCVATDLSSARRCSSPASRFNAEGEDEYEHEHEYEYEYDT
jgi:hypothetical protein